MVEAIGLLVVVIIISASITFLSVITGVLGEILRREY